VQVLVDGATIVILAEVDGAESANKPEVEWASTDGGATFPAVNTLKSVADGHAKGGETEPINAMVMPGGETLGYAFVTDTGEPPTFSDFLLKSPLECSAAKCTAGDAELPSAVGLSNEPGSVAAQQSAGGGVLGVFETLGAPGPTGCTFGNAYYYGEGNESATNSYNIGPGKPDTAWKTALTAGDCEVSNDAVGAGPSGLGVVEASDAGQGTLYHAFDRANRDFDTAPVTITSEGEVEASVSQDGSGGIYVTYFTGIDEIRLAYSPTGGATWIGPATINPDSDTKDNHLSSSVGADGQGWATWTDQGSVFVQPFIASDATLPAVAVPAVAPVVPPPTATTTTTTQAGAGLSAPSLTVPLGTAVTDQAKIAGTHAATATGTVSYTLYKDNKCTKAEGAAGLVSVVKGVPAHSIALKPAVGTYYWRVAYGGDAANSASTSACGSEVLTVATEDKSLGLPSTKICLSRRKFVVHPRAPKGVKLVSVEVLINGKLEKKGKLSKNATSVSLVGLPKGTFKVSLVTKSSKGKTYEDIRTFHTCVPGKHPKK
jgi:hypothetical protein